MYQIHQLLKYFNKYSIHISLFFIWYYFFLRVSIKYYSSFFGTLFLNITKIIFLAYIFLVFIGFFYKYFNKYWKNIYVDLFIVLFLYIGLSILYYQLANYSYVSFDVTIYQTKVLIYALANLCLGIVLYKSIDNSFYDRAFFSFWLIYMVFILLNIDYFLFAFISNSLVGAHQIVGDTFAIVTLISVFLIKNRWYKLISFTIVLVLLFMIKSRATFFSFLLLYFFWFIKEFGIKFFLLTIFIGLCMSLISIVLNVISFDQKMLGVFLGKQDNSLNERIEMMKFGIYAIKDHWFLGDYAGQMRVYEGQYRSGMMGAYIHNFLSFWRQFGLSFFILFMGMYIYGLYKNYVLLKYKKDYKNEFILYLGLFLFIEMLFFRSYTLPYYWFAMGLMFMNIACNKKMDKR